MPELACYDRLRTYEWNYEHAPDPIVSTEAEPQIGGNWEFCGKPVPSPLGISAGPLLNGRWLLYYASLGFDILTYKTVRSRARDCYELPNLVPVMDEALDIPGQERVSQAAQMHGSWAISFGMPSKAPHQWREDVRQTRQRLPPEKHLCVSVVATPESNWTMAEVADDYARCAAWAVSSGADSVELNFSCPNVTSCDGQIFQNASQARLVVETVAARLNGTPLIIKIGQVTDRRQAEELLTAIASCVNAVSMTNCIATQVQAESGLLFDGQVRGIGGVAILKQSLTQVAMFSQLIDQLQMPLRIIGVGGISSAKQVVDYLRVGAESVQLATAAMLDPMIGRKIKQDLRRVDLTVS